MSFSMSSYRKLLVNNCLSLKDFNYNLAMALINSSNDPYFQNLLVAQNNRIQASQVQQERLGPVDAPCVQQNLDTLAECNAYEVKSGQGRIDFDNLQPTRTYWRCE
jgi:hypothetical protein